MIIIFCLPVAVRARCPRRNDRWTVTVTAADVQATTPAAGRAPWVATIAVVDDHRDGNRPPGGARTLPACHIPSTDCRVPARAARFAKAFARRCATDIRLDDNLHFAIEMVETVTTDSTDNNYISG